LVLCDVFEFMDVRSKRAYFGLDVDGTSNRHDSKPEKGVLVKADAAVGTAAPCVRIRQSLPRGPRMAKMASSDRCGSL
jgi:hypothetical protein